MKNIVGVCIVALTLTLASSAALAAPGQKLKAVRPEVVNLGKTLFFDPRLSGANNMSCASCHNPMLGWSDGLPRARGWDARELERRTPTLLDIGLELTFFWDGRASTLEEQALGPITSPGEMNQELDSLERELSAVPGYIPLFEAAFPGQGITRAGIASALADYQRTIVHPRTPFERWLDGEETAMTEGAKRGRNLFFSMRTRCSECHMGPDFRDGLFWDIGVPGEDTGRGRLFPEEPLFQFNFKTPTLWNIARRAPYFHNGSVRTLREVVDHYDRGGQVDRPSLSMKIRPLRLREQEKQNLVEFLEALSAEDEPVSLPVLPR